MNLNFSEEQEMLRTSAKDYLVDKLPKATVKEIEASEAGYSTAMWKEMSDLGWMGLAFPEKYGGAGMTFFDLSVLLEEMGRACLPAPFFATVILGGFPILDFGTDAQKDEYLPAISGGKSIFTLAWTEPSASYEPAGITATATAQGDSFVLNGTKLFVPYANVADKMLVVARTAKGAKPEDGITVFIVDAKSPGIKTTALQSMANDKLCEVVLSNVKVSKSAVLGQVGQGWAICKKTMERAAAGKCCEMTGALQAVLDMTVTYSKDRKQFGKPIGSFQIIQHYCVDMLIDVETVRLPAYQAAWMVSEGLPCSEQVACAKGWAGQAATHVISLAHQVHGAIGWTIDHDLQYYTRRCKAWEVTFGDTGFYRKAVADMMGL